MNLLTFCFCLVLIFLGGASFGLIEGKQMAYQELSDTTNGIVQDITCYAKGCSVLVEYPSRTSEWLWMEVVK